MRFIDRYFYKPNILHIAISIVLLPISVLYFIVATIRRKLQRHYTFNVPIISVGNLVSGGSGKTPFIEAIAGKYSDVAIISRGYKRKSKGLLVVSIRGEIKVDEVQSGDEAFLLAKILPNASVIVSKNRVEAINEALRLGAKLIFLDDGFRFNFNKLNIVLVPKLEPYFKFTLPSGLYRENPLSINKADIVVKEGLDYSREVYIKNPTERMLLLTAIANPSRLDEYLPKGIVGKICLSDHSNFDLSVLREQIIFYNATSLLVTSKDFVKLSKCEIPISIMCLRLNITDEIKTKIHTYIQEYGVN